MDQSEIINYKFENCKIIKNAFDDSVKYSNIKKIIYYKIILAFIEYMNNDEYQDEQTINECESFMKKCINELDSKKMNLKIILKISILMKYQTTMNLLFLKYMVIF